MCGVLGRDHTGLVVGEQNGFNSQKGDSCSNVRDRGPIVPRTGGLGASLTDAAQDGQIVVFPAEVLEEALIVGTGRKAPP